MSLLRRLLDIERSDWMVSPGRSGIIEVGGLQFAVNTADGGALAFTVSVGRWSWGWQIYWAPR